MQIFLKFWKAKIKTKYIMFYCFFCLFFGNILTEFCVCVTDVIIWFPNCVFFLHLCIYVCLIPVAHGAVLHLWSVGSLRWSTVARDRGQKFQCEHIKKLIIPPSSKNYIKRSWNRSTMHSTYTQSWSWSVRNLDESGPQSSKKGSLLWNVISCRGAVSLVQYICQVKEKHRCM